MKSFSVRIFDEVHLANQNESYSSRKKLIESAKQMVENHVWVYRFVSATIVNQKVDLSNRLREVAEEYCAENGSIPENQVLIITSLYRLYLISEYELHSNVTDFVRSATSILQTILVEESGCVS